MFVPKYTITNSILRNIGVIDASKELIYSTSLVPFLKNKLKSEALKATLFYGMSIEGNKLTEEEVQFLLDGKEVIAHPQDIQEVLGYLNGLKFLQGLVGSGENSTFVLTLDTILELQKIVTEGFSPDESRGVFRSRQIVVKNTQTNQISYSPPPAAEIPYLMDDLITWINSDESKDLHPVIKSAIVHFEIYRLHPFSSGNNQIARLLSDLILSLEGYGVEGYLSVEEYFASRQMDYFLTLQSVANQVVMDVHERDLTKWLEFFVSGVSSQISDLKERIRKVATDSKVEDKLGEKVELSERQLIIMEYLHRHKEMRNKDFRKIFPDFSDDTVLREIKFLKQKGLVKKIGTTKMAVYVLA